MAIMSQPSDRLDPEVLKLAGVLLVGVLAVVFDTTIVNIALDRLASDLAVPISTVQWVTTGYLLALAMAVPVTGWLLDRFGGKQLWMAALALFLIGSVAASLAWDAPSLIVARIVQGIGGGLMLPVMQTLLVQAAGAQALGRVAAVISLPIVLGPILGPVLGGLILNSLGWRWIFWINVPFCLAGLFFAWLMLPAMPANRKVTLDFAGLLLLSPGTAALLYGLSQAVGQGFASGAALVPLALGMVLIGLFAWRALNVSAPLVDLRLLRHGSLAAASLQLFLSGFVLYGAMLLIPLYAQQLRGDDALTAGLLLAPQGLGLLLSRSLAGKLTDRFGARWVVVAGLVVVALGTLPFAGPGLEAGPWLLAATLVIRGIGLGAVTIPVMAAAYVELDRPEVPHASIITRTAQQIGGSFGTAVLAVILESGLAAQAATGGNPALAFEQSFWWVVGFTLVALVAAFWLPGRAAQAQPA